MRLVQREINAGRKDKLGCRWPLYKKESTFRSRPDQKFTRNQLCHLISVKILTTLQEVCFLTLGQVATVDGGTRR
jgi:hypothetical protein